MNRYQVTVLTATYNRAHTLKRLYESLCNQRGCSRFQWLVVDDGSTDETQTLVKIFKSDCFDFCYLLKGNGGKHTAINYAHEYIHGEVVVLVDSDDALTEDAVATIEADLPKWIDNSGVGCASYQRVGFDGKLISEDDERDEVLSTHTSYRIDGHRRGDRCEVIKTSELLSRPFPEYSGERFMSEGWLWVGLSNDGLRTLYLSKPIYLCEYLDGGLSRSGRRLRLASPRGMMDNCKAYFTSGCSLRTLVKEQILYWVYSFAAEQSVREGLAASGCGAGIIPWALPGWILYCYWSQKDC